MATRTLTNPHHNAHAQRIFTRPLADMSSPCVCMCVCVCVYIYIYIYIYIERERERYLWSLRDYTHLYTHTHTYLYQLMSTVICICTHISTPSTYAYTNARMDISRFIHIHVSTPMVNSQPHVYAHTYTYLILYTTIAMDHYVRSFTIPYFQIISNLKLRKFFRKIRTVFEEINAQLL